MSKHGFPYFRGNSGREYYLVPPVPDERFHAAALRLDAHRLSLRKKLFHSGEIKFVAYRRFCHVCRLSVHSCKINQFFQVNNDYYG